MGIRAFQPDSGLFEELLIQNLMASFLRSIFSRVSRFTAPLVRSAMPHVKSALESAKPHLSTAARSAFDEASRGVMSKLVETIGSVAAQPSAQSGSGRRRIIREKKLPRHSVTKLRRIPPFYLPDSF